MKSEEKTARAKLDKTLLAKPIQFSLLDLGGPEDPCFGTHEPQNSECKQCGDSEFCQIMKSQKNHVLRAKEEKKQPFKDKDADQHPELNEKNLSKFIKAKKAKGYDVKKVTRLAIKKFTPYISKFLVETQVEKQYEKAK